MTLINFKLQSIEKIAPFGSGDNLTLHWFALTDGTLWIQPGDNIIYEYTEQAIKHFGEKETPYNDYHISRFIEDFEELFEQIAESIPETIYSSFDSFSSFDNFLNETEDWLQKSDDDDIDFHENKYGKLTSWIYDRSLDSGHLAGGPVIWFLRNNDKIKIIWDADYKLENGDYLWTSPSGLIELDYSGFIKEVESFGSRFFDQMNNQLQLAIKKDFGRIKIDKQRLVEENKERKSAFFSALSKLSEKPQLTNWDLVDDLTKEMRKNC